MRNFHSLIQYRKDILNSNREIMKVIQKVIFICLLFFTVFGRAQKTQAQLEIERKELAAEIVSISELRKKGAARQQSVLEKVESLNRQIRVLDRLIRVTNQQANYISKKINANEQEIVQLNTEMENLKKDYSELIRKSYKSKSQQNRILFLLSSESFKQAYKRVQYIKQYAKYRKKQGIEIQERKAKIEKLTEALVYQKEDKKKLISSNKKTQVQLKKDRVEQKGLVAQIKKNQRKYAKQIKEQERKARAIDKQIERLIRIAVAKANKKAGAKKGTKTFALTAEAKVLAAKFDKNKGKLPWPVVKGSLIKRFGKQPHPVIPNIVINNSGVDIETDERIVARAIFDGEVSTVQAIKGAGKLVQIRHGNFISTYYNIEGITVKEGDRVLTKQSIGKVHTNKLTGRSILKFSIFKDSKFLNPQKWIFKLK